MANGAIHLQCQGLVAGYPGRRVLEGVDLAMHAGHATVLLGPNGSGKSTLLKTLSRELEPLEGFVEIEGIRLSNLSPGEVARRIAFVPQEEIPPFRFTVEQIVLMGRLPLSTGLFDTVEDHRAAEEAMRTADCDALRHRPISEISGGERQRALIARALAQNALRFLLDEPTSHLDIGHQIAIVRLVRQLLDQGCSVLAAMHDLNLACELGDHAILLHDGRIAVQGPVLDVLSSPRLDEAYGVRFERFEDRSGRLRVFAPSMGVLT